MNTHGVRCDFGRHRGELYTRIPVSYLRWMVNSDHSRKNIAESELSRRGTSFPELEISGHAIDRASLRCLDIWRKNRNDDEGLNSWLARVSAEAIESVSGNISNNRKVGYLDMLFVFEVMGKWPVLKTVMRQKG